MEGCELYGRKSALRRDASFKDVSFMEGRSSFKEGFSSFMEGCQL